MGYQPPFTLTNEILSLVADIAQKVGQIETREALDSSPRLRKENRIRTIHSSLAIENNTLSLDQVTAVLEGKHVIAPAKDILEVENAIAVYAALDSFNPRSMEDLLTAHKTLMKGLTKETGVFRSGNVGVFDGDKLIHAGTPATYVPEVTKDLFDWLTSSNMHPLVTSCIFHYEFEFIHPFQDGNGRMGRLWQTLLLASWNPLFTWLPVESLVKKNQADYYAALARADAAVESTCFVEFMLRMISEALDEAILSQASVGINVGINVGITNKALSKQEELLALIAKNPFITIAQMAEEIEVTKRQAERLVADLKKQGRIRREGAKRNGHWEIP